MFGSTILNRVTRKAISDKRDLSKGLNGIREKDVQTLGQCASKYKGPSAAVSDLGWRVGVEVGRTYLWKYSIRDDRELDHRLP